MKKFLVWAICSATLFACNSQKPAEEKTDEATTTASATPAPTPPAEIADAKYIEMGKRSIAALSAGNVDGWMNEFADNAVYIWGYGDSVVGKAAITDYWKKRRTEVIDSITFTNDIWLPVRVNQPQQAVQAPGVWLLSWYQTNAKYKTGKRMVQWIHTAMHIDSNDKVDRVLQFLDRVPIAAAMKK